MQVVIHIGALGVCVCAVVIHTGALGVCVCASSYTYRGIGSMYMCR